MYQLSLNKKTFDVTAFGHQEEFNFGFANEIFLKNNIDEFYTHKFDKLFVVGGKEFYITGGKQLTIKDSDLNDIDASSIDIESPMEERMNALLNVLIPNRLKEKKVEIQAFHFGVITRACNFCVFHSSCPQWCNGYCSWLTWACYNN